MNIKAQSNNKNKIYTAAKQRAIQLNASDSAECMHTHTHTHSYKHSLTHKNRTLKINKANCIWCLSSLRVHTIFVSVLIDSFSVYLYTFYNLLFVALGSYSPCFSINRRALCLFCGFYCINTSHTHHHHHAYTLKYLQLFSRWRNRFVLAGCRNFVRFEFQATIKKNVIYRWHELTCSI